MSVASARWCLRAQLPPDYRSAVIRLEHDTLVIGRQPGLDLTLSSRYVSERHAELTVFADRLYVTDLDSRNGTFVNGKRVRRAQLGIGDVLLIGDVQVRLDREFGKAGRSDDSPGLDAEVQESEWLADQFQRLLCEQPVSIRLQPIVQLVDGARVGYRPMLQSTMAGLESEARILAAARRLHREGELHDRLLKWRAAAAAKIGEPAFLYLPAPCGINLELELEPFLTELRRDAPGARIWLGVEDLPAYSLRALSRFSSAVQDLNIELVINRFRREQLRFLQTSKLRPRAAQLESILVQQLAADSGVRLQTRALCDQLHHYEMTAGLGGISTVSDLLIAKEVGIDLAAGRVFGEPFQLERIPQTAILTPAQIASLVEDSPASPAVCGS